MAVQAGYAHGSNATLVPDNAHRMAVEGAGVRWAPESAAETFASHATETLPGLEGGVIVAASRLPCAR